MMNAKQEFQLEFQKCLSRSGKVTKLVVGVLLPTGATEIIINTDNIEDKYDYYMNAYDDNMRLKNNDKVRIVGVMAL